MAHDIRILDGLSKLVRESVGVNAANRVEDDEPDGEDDDGDPPSAACSSAAGNTDLTVLDS